MTWLKNKATGNSSIFDSAVFALVGNSIEKFEGFPHLPVRTGELGQRKMCDLVNLKICQYAYYLICAFKD